MYAIINRYTTPLTTGLFAISAISGIALFFHWQSGLFHGMHEWLSMALLIPFGLHMWKNWGAMVTYAKRGWLVLPLVFSLILALPFVAQGLGGSSRGGNPAFRALPLMTQAPISQVAPLFKTTPDALLAKLKQQGLQATSTEQSLAAIAQNSGKQANEVLFSLLPPQ